MSAGFADHILNYASITASVIERFCVWATSTFPIMCNRLAALCLPNTLKILGRVGATGKFRKILFVRYQSFLTSKALRTAGKYEIN